MAPKTYLHLPTTPSNISQLESCIPLNTPMATSRANTCVCEVETLHFEYISNGSEDLDNEDSKRKGYYFTEYKGDAPIF